MIRFRLIELITSKLVEGKQWNEEKILVQNKAREKEKVKRQKVDTNRNHTIS